MRSTGLPTARPLGSIVRVIRMRASAKTVQRVTETTGSLDQTTESTDGHTEDMWLHSLDEGQITELAGERVEGDLGALLVADGTVDLQTDDRLTYGGVEYEVDTVVGKPNDADADGTASPETDFWIASLTRRH